jgi:hypothetical protein
VHQSHSALQQSHNGVVTKAQMKFDALAGSESSKLREVPLVPGRTNDMKLHALRQTLNQEMKTLVREDSSEEHD